MEIWIIDSSSLIQVRQGFSVKNQVIFYRALTQLVQNEQLVYPKQVLDELKRYSNPKGTKPDRPLDWAKSNEIVATRHGQQSDALKEILAHPQVPRIFDPDKVGIDEADPYMLAFAHYLRTEGEEVTVLSEERKDRPDKLSMTTACAHLRLICMPIDASLASKNILH